MVINYKETILFRKVEPFFEQYLIKLMPCKIVIRIYDIIRIRNTDSLSARTIQLINFLRKKFHTLTKDCLFARNIKNIFHIVKPKRKDSLYKRSQAKA